MAIIVYDLNDPPAVVCYFNGGIADYPLTENQIALPCQEGTDPRDPELLALLNEDSILAALRSLAVSRINRWRVEQENRSIIFTHAGREWDGGLSVRIRIKPCLSQPTLPVGFFWTDAHNNDVLMSTSDVGSLDIAHERALVARGWEIHIQQKAMKASLLTLSAEQLRNYQPEVI